MTDDLPLVGKLPRRAEVLVVGGGIAGTSAAYHLATAGVEVVLLEKRTLGGGATGDATGILSPPIRQPFHETVRFLGESAASDLWAFALSSVHGLAALLESRDAQEATGLDLRGGYVLAEPHTQYDLTRSFEALVRAGLPVEALSSADVTRATGGRGFTGGFRIDGLGGLRPAMVPGILGSAAAEAGATVLEGVGVNGVAPTSEGYVVATKAGNVAAERVVYAAHTHSGRFSRVLDRLVVPIRGQGFITAPMPQRFAGAFSTHWKMNVWRQDPSGRVMASGWRHDAWNRSYGASGPGLDPTLQADLQGWFEAVFPLLAPVEVEHRWSGLFGWTADFLPLVGALPGSEGELVITGFSGGGLPFAFESGRVIADLVVGREAVPGAALLDPGRFA